MINWINIHPNLTNQLQWEWYNRSFTVEETKAWIDAGLQVNDFDYAYWLKEIKRIGAEYLLNHGDSNDLKKQYEKYLESQFLATEKEKSAIEEREEPIVLECELPPAPLAIEWKKKENFEENSSPTRYLYFPYSPSKYKLESEKEKQFIEKFHSLLKEGKRSKEEALGYLEEQLDGQEYNCQNRESEILWLQTSIKDQKSEILWLQTSIKDREKTIETLSQRPSYEDLSVFGISRGDIEISKDLKKKGYSDANISKIKHWDLFKITNYLFPDLQAKERAGVIKMLSVAGNIGFCNDLVILFKPFTSWYRVLINKSNLSEIDDRLQIAYPQGIAEETKISSSEIIKFIIKDFVQNRVGEWKWDVLVLLPNWKSRDSFASINTISTFGHHSGTSTDSAIYLALKSAYLNIPLSDKIAVTGTFELAEFKQELQDLEDEYKQGRIKKEKEFINKKSTLLARIEKLKEIPIPQWKIRAVGGIRAKVKAAIEKGAKIIILPEENYNNYYLEILDDTKAQARFKFVKWVADLDNFLISEQKQILNEIEMQQQWTNFHPSFTPDLIQSWTNYYFTLEQTRQWINIGLTPSDYALAAYLRDIKQLTSEQVLNFADFQALKQEFQTYQQNQQTPQIIHIIQNL